MYDVKKNNNLVPWKCSFNGNSCAIELRFQGPKCKVSLDASVLLLCVVDLFGQLIDLFFFLQPKKKKDFLFCFLIVD